MSIESNRAAALKFMSLLAKVAPQRRTLRCRSRLDDFVRRSRW